MAITIIFSSYKVSCFIQIFVIHVLDNFLIKQEDLSISCLFLYYWHAFVNRIPTFIWMILLTRLVDSFFLFADCPQLQNKSEIHR